MEAHSTSEQQSAEVNRAAHLGRIAERIDRISNLNSLLKEEDAATVVAALRRGGYSVDGDGFEEKSLEEVKAAIAEGVAQMEAWNNEVTGLTEAVKRGLVGTVAGPKSLEHAEIDARLQSLVVAPINALPEDKRTVQGRVRSGEEIAGAIPDLAAFLAEVGLQSQDGILLDFFELNEEGELVMKDDCKEAYGLGENGLQAKIRQTRIVYTGKGGQTQVMTGKEYFNVTEQDRQGRPLKMEVSEAATGIDPQSILMARGLPTLKSDGERHTGEYARMNTGQLERSKITWTEDDSLDISRARYAYWLDSYGRVNSNVYYSYNRYDALGSRGVLRVNLNFES